MAEKNFYEYLAVNDILCNMNGLKSEEIIEKMLGLLKKHFPHLDVDYARIEVFAREKIYPTVIAKGLAVPHARIPGLEKPLVAMACSQDGISFGVEDPVHVMVLLLTPYDDPNLHMQLLSALAKDFSKIEDISLVSRLTAPLDVYSFFSRITVTVPEYLRAKDVMDTNYGVLHETDTLSQAIEKLSMANEVEFPVIDKTGDLRGMFGLYDLLHYCMPEHLLWMEDLTPMYKFQPFTKVMQSADETKVADLLRTEFIQVDWETPAIQLSKLFLMNKTPTLVITKDGGKLAGVVTLRNFSYNLFWK